MKKLLIIVILTILMCGCFKKYEEKDGLYYQKGTVNLYTGEVSEKNNNSKIIFYCVDGKKDGVYTEYYEDGETEKIVCNYKSNKKEGKYEEFYKNGSTKNLYNFKNDKLDGTQKTYYKDVINDLEHNSAFSTYNIHFTLKSSAEYKNGKREGISKEYYKNGSLQSSCKYENDKLVSFKKSYFVYDIKQNIEGIEIYIEEIGDRDVSFKGVQLRLENHTASVIELDWNSSNIGGSNLFLSGQKYIDAGKQVPNLVVSPDSVLEKDLYPSNAVGYYESTRYFIPPSNWQIGYTNFPSELVLKVIKNNESKYIIVKLDKVDFVEPEKIKIEL